MNFRLSLELLGFLLSLGSVVAGFLLWYSASVTKAYAAKRDFEHLKRHYEQLAVNQAQILTEIDRLQDSVNLDLRDMQNKLNLLLMKQSQLPDKSE